MAQDSPRSDAVTDGVLAYLERWSVAQIENVGEDRATVTLRATTLRELIRRARFGKGLATVQARPFAVRSAAGKHAAHARWARVRARKAAALAMSHNTTPEKSTS